jgi:hypothetical protein
VKIVFSITLHEKDKALLEEIKNFFGTGKIFKSGEQLIKLRIESIKELLLIIDHFEKYPLISQKRADFELLKQAFFLVRNKEHLTEEGLKKIVAIKASINTGLSDQLKKAFPDIIPVKKPKVVDQAIRDPN